MVRSVGAAPPARQEACAKIPVGLEIADEVCSERSRCCAVGGPRTPASTLALNRSPSCEFAHNQRGNHDVTTANCRNAGIQAARRT